MNCSGCRARLEASNKYCSRCGLSTSSTKTVNPKLAKFINWCSKPYARLLLPFALLGIVMLLSAVGIPYSIGLIIILTVVFRLLMELGAKKSPKPSLRKRTTEITEVQQSSADLAAEVQANPSPYPSRAQKNMRAGFIFIASGVIAAVIIPLAVPKSGNAGADSFYQVISLLLGVLLIGVGILNLVIGSAQKAYRDVKNKKDAG